LLAFYAANAGFAAEKAELKRHTVMSDGHPMALWEKSAGDASEAILLVHGRTWSALPDFDLRVEGEDLSLMDGLVAEGYAVFAVDLRGYGRRYRVVNTKPCGRRPGQRCRMDSKLE
jgi:alpha-beta hydrolase superfamily lysophospholipase